MFAITFLLAATTYVYLATGIHNTESESLLQSNLYHYSMLPTMIALLFAIGESLFKIKNFDMMFKMFLAILALSCILVFLPFSIADICIFIRQFMGVAIIAISTYLLVRTKVVSNMMFLMSMTCFIVAGVALVRDMEYFSIFAYLMAHIFLTTIFIVAPQSTKKDEYDVSSYFSLKSKLTSTEQNLLESEARYKTLFDSSPDAIMMLAEDGEILSINTIMAKGFGTSVEELTGKNIHSLLPKDVDEQRTTAAKKALEMGEIQTNEDERQGRYFHNSFVPIFASDGKKRIQVIARDITKQKKVEKQLDEKIKSLEESELATLNIMKDLQETVASLEKAKQEINDKNEKLQTNAENLAAINKELSRYQENLKKLNENLEEKVKERTAKVEVLLKQKDEFIGQLGHDLKNPLSPVVTLLPIVKKRVNDPELEMLLDVIIKNANYMKNLVVKTLRLARLNSSNVRFEIGDANLYEEINKVVNNKQFLFNEQDIKIENLVDGKLCVQADVLRLDELFDNLLSNSVKYSQHGCKVIIDAKEEDDFVTVSVTDNGVGLTSEQISQIFNEFYKADESRHEMDSVGLGLPICKRIVEKHGGKIWAKSQGPGCGTTFYFTLKSEKASEADN